MQQQMELHQYLQLLVQFYGNDYKSIGWRVAQWAETGVMLIPKEV